MLILVTGAALLAAGCSPSASNDTPKPIASLGAFGGPGVTPGRYVKPRAIDTDGRDLWVIDRSGRVQRVDADTGVCIQYFMLPTTERGFPTGLKVSPGPVSPDGTLGPCLYIADTHSHRVLVYALPARPAEYNPEQRWDAAVAEPKLVMQFGTFGEGPGQFLYPTDVEVLLSADGTRVERLYVSEYGGNDRIQVFSGSGEVLFTLGSPGSQPGTIGQKDYQFQRPQSLLILPASPAVGGQAELVVSDSVNHRIGRFTLDGRLLGWIGSPQTAGTAQGVMQHPRGLRALPDGTLLTVEFGNNRVQRFDRLTGRSLGAWGRAGRGPGDLAEPWSLAIVGRRAFVVDALNHRLVVMNVPSG